MPHMQRFAIVSVADTMKYLLRIAFGTLTALFGTRLDVVSRAHRNVGTYCATAQGKSPLPDLPRRSASRARPVHRPAS